MSEAIEAVTKLKERFPESVVGYQTDRAGESVVSIKAADLIPVSKFLRDELKYNYLVDVTAIDRLKLGQQPRFVTVYQLHSMEKPLERIRIKAEIPDDSNPEVDSVVDVWPTANWHEREAYDMFGIKFKGHPDLRRILMPHDWVGHPLRKDYPLGGPRGGDYGQEHIPFTVNWDDEEFRDLGKQVVEVGEPYSVPPKKADTNRHMVINMGPQHPATHGVLRVIAELDGERVVALYPDIGYLHSGFEKTGESKRYKDFIPYTDRMDYLSAMSNNLGYVLAVEKLLGIEVPERARVIRVILVELQRIASHLMWLGTHVLDISGTIHALLMYAFREREMILNIFELVCGARLTTAYFRFGGLSKDVPPRFVRDVEEFLEIFPKRLQQYRDMLDDNPLWKGRTVGIGKISQEEAIAMGVTGPILRATGIPYDVRKVRPYCGYETYDFEIPTETEGDIYARYLVRMREMEQSIRIIRQALDRLPEGPVLTDNYKVAYPPREEIDRKMEALIHHFKIATEGVVVPPGEVYQTIAAPKGELGFYVVSDGSPKPYRLRVRGPSFVNLQALDIMGRGELLSDVVAIIGSIDIVLGEVDR